MVAWGKNNHGQCNVPEPNKNFVAVSGGYQFSLGLRSNGMIEAWGYNFYGQCNVPEPNEGFMAVEAGDYHAVGIKPLGPSRVEPTTWGRLKSIFK
jgi:alpha-tubulin suppressor-like RCC1 family protein